MIESVYILASCLATRPVPMDLPKRGKVGELREEYIELAKYGRAFKLISLLGGIFTRQMVEPKARPASWAKVKERPRQSCGNTELTAIDRETCE
jgi:hypothetical protein